jgi:hypothetical protein
MPAEEASVSTLISVLHFVRRRTYLVSQLQYAFSYREFSNSYPLHPSDGWAASLFPLQDPVQDRRSDLVNRGLQYPDWILKVLILLEYAL